MKTEFKIKFDGQLHQVDVNTLLNSLFNITAILQEINNEIEPGEKLNIKVNAFTTGSFNIDLQLVQGMVKSIFSKDNVNYVVDVLVGIFTIKQLFKGKKVETVIELDDGKLKIGNEGEEITIDKPIYDIYRTNHNINDSMEKTFETLSDDPSIEGFSISDKNNTPLFTAESKDFAVMTNRNVLLEKDEESRTLYDDNAMLSIFKIVFDRNRKWEFYYNGNRISAKILDEDFFNHIDNYKFSKGDILDVRLQITQHYEATLKTYVNKFYDVIKINKHIPSIEQPSLDFNH